MDDSEIHAKVIMLKRYIGNPDAYAAQQDDGSYFPSRAPLSAAVLEDHVRGKVTVGTYVLHFDKARFMCFDIDDGNMPQASRILAVVKKYGLNGSTESSGRKGFHVWVLFDIPEPGDEVQRLAKTIASEAGFNGEVFPKQAVARDLGNLVKLPYGVHRVSGNRSHFFGVPPLVNHHDRFERAMAKLGPVPVPKPSASTPEGLGTYPCMESIQTDPPGDGERNNCLIHFAVMLRREGLVDPFVETVVRALNEQMSDPVDDWKIDEVVRNSRTLGPCCDGLEQRRKCGDLCVKTRYQSSALWPGKLRHAPEGSRVILEVGARDGATVELRHPDIATSRARLA